MSSSIDRSQSSLLSKHNHVKELKDRYNVQQNYQPGQPIGYLAARGTIYERKYFSRKLAACLLFFGVPITLIILVLISGPILLAVANHIVNVSRVHLNTVHLDVSTQNRSSLPIVINGRITNTGIFPATVQFRSPIDLFWNTPPPELKEVRIGSLNLSHIGVTSSGQGTINQATDLYNINSDALSLLASFLAKNEEFTLKLNCSSVHLAALGFLPAWKNIAISKHVVVKGLKGLNDVSLKYFNIPSDDPVDGAMFQAIGLLHNPSPFDVSIGNLSVNLFYRNMTLGQTNLTNFMLHAGFNTLPLQGRIFSHADSQHDLEILSNLVESVVNNINVSISVQLEPKTGIPDWIQAAVDALHISVIFRLPEPLQLIERATIGALNATITSNDSYHPKLSSNDILAQVRVPFGLSLSIVSVNVSLDIGQPSKAMMAAHLEGMQANASSTLNLISPGVRQGNAIVRLEDSVLSPLGTDKSNTNAFDSLIADFFLNKTVSIGVHGSAAAIIDSSLGRLTVNTIHLRFFTEPFAALSGFKTEPAKVLDFDITGATTESISILATAQINNPSLLTVKVVGTVGVSILFQDNKLGIARISNLMIAPGINDIQAEADQISISGKSNSLISNYLAQKHNSLQVIGSSEDTTIDLLKSILSLVDLTADLPGLKDSLLLSTQIEVLNSTDVGGNNILDALPSVRNPFSCQITVSSANGTGTLLGIQAAKVDEARIVPPLMVDTKNAINRQTGAVEADVNFAPSEIFGLVRGLLIEAGQDLNPLDYLLQIAGIKPTQAIVSQPYSMVHKREYPFDGFNLPNYINAALMHAKADINVSVEAQIGGKYPVYANLQQNGVPILFDTSVEQLYSRVGKPIIDIIIANVNLDIISIDVINFSNDQVLLTVQAQLSNIGPFDATVSFPKGVEIFFEGALAGIVALPNITITPESTKLNFQTTFAVASESVMEEMVEAIIIKPSIEWLIKTDLLHIEAFGAQLTADFLKKVTQVSTFNSFRNSVSLDVFDLPSDDKLGGIHITASADVQNPSQIGVSLDRLGLTFNLQASPDLGEIQIAKSLSLPPLQKSTVFVAGRILPQTGSGLQAFQKVIQNYVANLPTKLEVKGIFAGPEDILWLNKAISQFSIEVLVAGSPDLNPVEQVKVDVVSVDFTSMEAQSWSPLISSNNISAKIAIPFNFPFSVDEVFGLYEILYEKQSAGQLELPLSTASTTERTVQLSITDAHLDIKGANTRKVFANQLAVQTLLGTSIQLGLNAKAAATITTSAGTVSVQNVNIHLEDALGLEGFRRLASLPINVSGLDVLGGKKSFALASVNVAINNPSNIHAIVGDISLDIFYNDNPIGTAEVKEASLQVGDNLIPVQVQAKLNSKDGKQVVRDFLAGGEGELTFRAKGETASTAFDSLNPAVSEIDLTVAIPPLKAPLVTKANLRVPLTIGQDLKVQAQFQFTNPFSADIEIINARAKAYSENALLATVDTSIKLNTPGHSTVESHLFDVQIAQNVDALIGFFIHQASLARVDIQALLPLLTSIRSASSLRSSVIYSISKEYITNANTFEGAYDVVNSIERTLQGALIRADASANVKLGEYMIDDAQVFISNISLSVDDSVRYLIGPFGAPIVEQIAKEVAIEIMDLKIENLSQEGFDVQTEVLLRGIGPFAAQISFPKPIDALYQNRKIAELSLPSFDLTSSGRVSLRLRLNIVDQDAFGAFVADAINKPAINIDISTNSVRASAYGINFASISVQRSITINGFDGLPGVLVGGVNVIGDTESTLLIAASASVPSKSSIEASVPILSFNFLYDNQILGQADVGPALLLRSNSTTTLDAKGYVSQIENDLQREALGQVASLFISNQTFKVDVIGQSAKDLNGHQISWLTNALKNIHLTVEVKGQDLNFVKSVELADLTAVIPSSETAYDFPLSTNVTSVEYFVPLPIHVTPQIASGTVVVYKEVNGVEAATVELQGIPLRAEQILGGGAISKLALSLHNTHIRALERKALEDIISVVLSQPTLSVQITGSVQAQVLLAVGQITVSNVRLDLPVRFAALDNLLGSVKVDGLPRVTGGNSDHAIAEVTVKLQNPSIITARIPSVQIPVFLDNVSIGAAIVNGVEIQPGECTLNVTFLVKLEQPIGSPTAIKLVRQLIQPVPGTNNPYYTDLIARGIPNAVPSLSPLGSINPGLETLHLALSLEGIAVQLIQLINIQIDILTLTAGPGGLPYVSAK